MYNGSVMLKEHIGFQKSMKKPMTEKAQIFNLEKSIEKEIPLLVGTKKNIPYLYNQNAPEEVECKLTKIKYE